MANDLAILEQQLTPLAPRFSEALAGTMPVERLTRTIMISCERLPLLLDCDRQSLFNAAMSAACLGLEVDGVTGQAFLIPFAKKAQLVIGYKGYNTLAARSGITITGSIVRDGDEFDFDLAEGWVKHKPKLDSKGRIIAAWAKASHNNRPPVLAVMGIGELMEVKEKSPGAKRRESPWNDMTIGFPAMCEKTVKRRLARSLPLNVMQLAARLDEAFDEQGKAAHITPDRNIIIDGEFSEPSSTPTAAELLDRSPRPSSRTDEAADQPAPSQPPSSQADGAGEVPTYTAAEYVADWDDRIADSEAAALPLHQRWNSALEKQIRAQAFDGNKDDPRLLALVSRVSSKIAELKRNQSKAPQ